jgi:hypothetical protein
MSAKRTEGSERQYATLATMKEGRFVSVLLSTPYGENLWFKLGLLSYIQWHETIGEVERPAIPRTLKGADGAKLPNPDDVGYVQDMAAYERDCRLRLVGTALKLGGMELPGDDAEAWADAIDEADAGIVNALWSFLQAASQKVEARPEDQAETFLAVRRLEARRQAKVRADAGAMEALLRGREDGNAGGDDAPPEAPEPADREAGIDGQEDGQTGDGPGGLPD